MGTRVGVACFELVLPYRNRHGYCVNDEGRSVTNDVCWIEVNNKFI